MPGCTAVFFSALTATLFCAVVGQTKFTMSAEQEVYHAEGNSNITLTWLLRFDTNRPPDFLQIEIINVEKKTRVFFYNSETGTEVYPDENYRGRLQCDPQLARKGRLECLLTDLRLNDTGTYHCIVVLNEEVSSKTCDLNVTAAVEKKKTETLKPESRERISLYLALGLFVVVIFALSLHYGDYGRSWLKSLEFAL
ncbi:programmed cell death 1 ligand 1-like [Simochromis diagramma]|uniref:programmed cell death 1 ligand 1-like n=1 Tax=Simochromis diagramma TaxID=43689 RepID=UPI001A7E6CE4|nr:programmed cell death 1 ligand 1-like [Simochromis diagramma]XP_039874865.1 programmed cell death 1 ligand 1-like [Simochromis diagramma]